MEIDQFKSELHSALNKERPYEDYEIDARRCSSDSFDGVEFTITGEWVDVPVVYDVLRGHDKLFAESVGAAHHEDGNSLVIFVVELKFDPTNSATLREAKL